MNSVSLHGTIKRTLGWDHFLVRTKNKVLGENALIMFTYNFRRLLNLIGIDLFKKLCFQGKFATQPLFATFAIKNKDLTQITKDIEEYILMFGIYIACFLQYIFYFINSQKKINNY